jgi:hypothetical protein
MFIMKSHVTFNDIVIPENCVHVAVEGIPLAEMQDFVEWGAVLTIDHKLSVPRYVRKNGNMVPDVVGCYYNRVMVEDMLRRVRKDHK